ncbi:hypothetical protein CIK05_05155 [Bdellovibrio sp. qaytius]|nr:hypothetical protein CIK05_05155 [Bdellovibrio sp. qaytius]
MKKLLLSVLLLANVAWADDIKTCGLPICNSNAKIEEMRAMNQDGRFNLIKGLNTDYRAETKAAILSNLLDFAAKAKALTIEMKDEAWVTREADTLSNIAVVGLVKYDKINKDLMITRFSQVQGEGAAFDILSYWSSTVDKLDDIQEVLQVTGFAEYAKQWSIDTKQEAYVTREAEKILVVGGKQVSRLNPSHEGAYKIKITCITFPKECGELAKNIQYMSVFDTLTAKGLSVNLADSQLSAPLYIFSTALLTNNGTHVRGISTDATPMTRASEIDLDIDMATGHVTGLLIDALVGEMKIEGVPVRRMSEFYLDKGPTRIVEVTEILGRYEGTLAGSEATLTVSRYSTGELVAIIDFAGSMLNFRAGAYNTKRGVLQFAGTAGNMGDRKLVLALRNNGKGKEVLTGFMLTATPKTPVAEFHKVGNIK